MTLPVVVYGASGYSGRLIVAALMRNQTPCAIAGRDGAKLAELNRQLGATLPIIVAPLDDAAALRRMCESARVVLDCAGPFARMGRPVQDAALATRRHFLDITGEVGYMRDSWARDAEAKSAGIALINGVGFDVVPTDAAAQVAAEALAQSGSPVELVKIAFATPGSSMSQGTARSMLESMHLGSLAFVDGEWRREPVAAESWLVPFSAPLGQRLAVSIPWGDVATAPRSTGARNVRTFLAVPRGGRTPLRLLGKLGGLMALAPVRALSERIVRSRPEGPSDAERKSSSFSIYAEASSERGRRAVWVTGGNGYDLTAESAALCARLAAGEGFAKSGALTPAQAFGGAALLDALAPHGVRWGHI